MENFEDENPKNIYVIRRRLAALKKWNSYWIWQIGNFSVQISSQDYHDVNRNDPLDSIVKHEKLQVDLYENSPRSSNLRTYVYLHSDPRFMNYIPIQYNVIETPTGGRVNLSNGRDMPVLHLCELIRYLHRLFNLTAFA
jgi:hypothetical protein